MIGQGREVATGLDRHQIPEITTLTLGIPGRITERAIIPFLTGTRRDSAEREDACLNGLDSTIMVDHEDEKHKKRG
ncbi:hypothetical protein A2U01_0045512, partial [Trifolium medium]|nr:hypothetical protein [Trifolium medium]